MGAHTKNMGRYDNGMDFVCGYGDAKGGVLRVPKKIGVGVVDFLFYFFVVNGGMRGGMGGNIFNHHSNLPYQR